jgi:S-adenosylmethionine/arginine decarboxylase-like enzyme
MSEIRPAFKGTHLIIDGLVKNDSTFSNENISAMFEVLVKSLGMYVILGPIFKVVEVDPTKLDYTAFADSGGTSAFCMISCSHISIHVWPLTRTFQFDAFSCKEFDAKKAYSIVEEYMQIEEQKTQVVERTQLDYT